MKKREKFLLSFCIAVVLLLILYYIAAVSGYNMSVNDPEQYLSGETFENGTEYIKMYFMDEYGIDINTNPEFIFAENIIFGTEMASEMIFGFICSVIVLTTIIYLMMIIKINSFKEYWKDLFKGLIIIIFIVLIMEFLHIIHYNFIVPNIEIESTIGGILLFSLLAWGTMVVGNIILNIKKFKMTKKTTTKE